MINRFLKILSLLKAIGRLLNHLFAHTLHCRTQEYLCGSLHFEDILSSFCRTDKYKLASLSVCHWSLWVDSAVFNLYAMLLFSFHRSVRTASPNQCLTCSPVSGLWVFVTISSHQPSLVLLPQDCSVQDSPFILICLQLPFHIQLQYLYQSCHSSVYLSLIYVKAVHHPFLLFISYNQPQVYAKSKSPRHLLIHIHENLVRYNSSFLNDFCTELVLLLHPLILKCCL